MYQVIYTVDLNISCNSHCFDSCARKHMNLFLVEPVPQLVLSKLPLSTLFQINTADQPDPLVTKLILD